MTVEDEQGWVPSNCLRREDIKLFYIILDWWFVTVEDKQGWVPIICLEREDIITCSS